MQGTGDIAAANALDERVQLWDEIEDTFEKLSETGVMFLEPSSTRGSDLLLDAFIKLRDTIRFVAAVQKDLYSLGLVPSDNGYR